MKAKKKILKKENLLLYAITDRRWLSITKNGNKRKPVLTLEEQVELSIKAGVTMLQLREKDIKDDEFLKEAISIKKICNQYNIPLIINDNIEVAKAISADGVHLGQADLKKSEKWKDIKDELIIGISASNVNEAKIAEENGADYLGVGDIFGTLTKDNARHISVDILKDICNSVSIPVIAIGGINSNNIKELTYSNISGVAVISAIFSEEDINYATKNLRRRLDNMILQKKEK